MFIPLFMALRHLYIVSRICDLVPNEATASMNLTVKKTMVLEVHAVCVKYILHTYD